MNEEDRQTIEQLRSALRESHAVADFWFRERIALRAELDGWRQWAIQHPQPCPCDEAGTVVHKPGCPSDDGVMVDE